MMQATDFEIGMIFESLRRREQDGVIPMLFQHSLSIIQEKHPDVSATKHRWQQPHQSNVPA